MLHEFILSVKLTHQSQCAGLIQIQSNPLLWSEVLKPKEEHPLVLSSEIKFLTFCPL